MVMATLGEGEDPRGVAKAIGPFNLSWSVAWIPGTVLAGASYQISPRLPFLLGAMFYTVAGLLVFLRRRRPTHAADSPTVSQPDQPPPPAPNRQYLLAMWICTPLAGIAVSIVRPFLQLETLQHGLSALEVNLLVAVLPLVQSCIYYAVCQVHFWHYKRLPLAVVGVGGALGAVLLFAAYNQPAAVATRVACSVGALMVIALCFPLYYTSSLLYGLNVRSGRGANTSIHEGLVGVGISAGPFIGGLVAWQWTYHVTFLVAAGMVAATLVVQWVLLHGRRAVPPIEHPSAQEPHQLGPQPASTDREPSERLAS